MAALVRVGAPFVETEAGHSVPMGDALVLTCSDCGELTDWEPLTWRPMLQRQAAVHASEAHDGLVERQGWA